MASGIHDGKVMEDFSIFQKFYHVIFHNQYLVSDFRGQIISLNTINVLE
jgi:hypothetical protein